MSDKNPELLDQNSLLQQLEATLQRLEKLEHENEYLRTQLTARRAESNATAASTADKVQEDIASVALEHAHRLASASSRIRELRQSRNSLRASESWLRAILESATDYAIITLDLNGAVTSWNSGARNILGWDEDEVLGRNGAFFFTSEDREAGVPKKEMQTAVAQGRAGDERWHLKKDGTCFWGNGVLMPIKDGELLGYLKILRDRTEERQSEQDLRESQERLWEILESISDAFYAVDHEWRFTYINRKTEEIWSRRREDLIGKVYWEEFPQSVASIPYKAHQQAMQERRPVRIEALSPIVKYWVDISIYPTADGGLSVYFRDISERKRAEEHQRLLINELNHRVKNTLATVQSITSQTLRTAATPEAAREAIASRLIALSRAHDVLTRENWEGAYLREIICQAIEPYRWYGDGRFDIRGPEVRLSPRVALAMAMALQELVTNAVKYGALSNGTGRVMIVWTLTGDAGQPVMEMCWEEMGGPPVQEPSCRGFGTRLIERSLAQELSGKVEIKFEPSGVVCTMVSPLAVETQLER
ncbi:sensor histidine kinase [Microvirga sp. VF16]|uniref:sensor histidine kinase n=1 Tax=Microvirga sp. VF16 TaxID=2807101 RepID=UPI00193D00F5|nr:PAS domain S-box protein [Microvirga sp. VF16]QRM34094.1 PAS domain S-box protein [Microvirga sp. VF16]